MIALDTNILVYAHRRDSPFHTRALDIVDALGNGHAPWAIPWPCVHEFLSITTHPRVYQPPSKLDEAIRFLENWFESPSLVFLGEGDIHFATLARISRAAHLAGPRIHDARIAALCMAHGVTVLYSADRDFSCFPDLKTENPLL
jgi:toxin-antitoxin system PIN domain toxin